MGTSVGDGTARSEAQSTRTDRVAWATLAPLEVAAYTPSVDAQPGPQGKHGKAIALINTGLNIWMNVLGV